MRASVSVSAALVLLKVLVILLLLALVAIYLVVLCIVSVVSFLSVCSSLSTYGLPLRQFGTEDGGRRTEHGTQLKF